MLIVAASGTAGLFFANVASVWKICLIIFGIYLTAAFILKIQYFNNAIDKNNERLAK